MEVPDGTDRHNLILLSRRLDAGLSQRQMAEEIGVSRRVYQHAERGGTPQPRHAAKFADHYGISVMDLFYGDLEVAA